MWGVVRESGLTRDLLLIQSIWRFYFAAYLINLSKNNRIQTMKFQSLLFAICLAIAGLTLTTGCADDASTDGTTSAAGEHGHSHDDDHGDGDGHHDGDKKDEHMHDDKEGMGHDKDEGHGEHK